MQMKQLFLLTILCLSSFAAFAQNEDTTVTLDEVVVKAPKVVSKLQTTATAFFRSSRCPTFALIMWHIL